MRAPTSCAGRFQFSVDFVMLSIACILTAFAVRFFFSPFLLTPGGITGLSISVSTITNIPVDIISLSISIPLLIISTLVLGKSFGIKTLYITLLTPVCIRLVPSLTITSNTLIASVLGGILVGVSIGLALSRSAATGGTDIIALLINKIFKKLDVPTILFILDISIVLSSWAISKDFKTSIYSALSLLVIMQSIKISTKLLK